MFIRLTVVAVEQQFFLINLNDRLWTLLCTKQGPCTVLHFHPRLVCVCRIFTLFKIGRFYDTLNRDWNVLLDF